MNARLHSQVIDAERDAERITAVRVADHAGIHKMTASAFGAAMVAGGAALTLDKLPRLAALGLIVSMIPTTLAGHAFWDFDGVERKAHEIQFLKNAGLVGGLLWVLRGSR